MREPEWWGRVAGEVAAYQRANPENLPGAVFAAETARDGPLVGHVGEGWGEDTICEIGSMTKAFTATAVLLALEERGLLDVEAPVWRLPGMEAYAGEAAKRQIRVRHLLQHTSGLPNTQPYTASPAAPCNDPTGEAPCCCGSDDDLDLGPTTSWTCFPGGTNECIYAEGRCQPARRLTLDQVSSYIMQVYSPPESIPSGTQYSYSPLNYIVAGRIVEQLTGRSLNLYLRDRLFAPLGMRDSFFIAGPTGDPAADAWLGEGVEEGQRARVAETALITRDGRMPPEVAPGPGGGWDRLRRGWRYVYPDGGMYTTASDLLAYLRALRDGGWGGGRQVLPGAVVGLLTGDQGFGHTMGFGFRGQGTPYGQGPGTLEHLGSKMTYFWYDPRGDDPMLGVFLSQRLPNIAVNMNMAVGMKVIFRVFLLTVNSAVYGFEPPQPA